jgi:hypothetical protein
LLRTVAINFAGSKGKKIDSFFYSFYQVTTGITNENRPKTTRTHSSITYTETIDRSIFWLAFETLSSNRPYFFHQGHYRDRSIERPKRITRSEPSDAGDDSFVGLPAHELPAWQLLFLIARIFKGNVCDVATL